MVRVEHPNGVVVNVPAAKADRLEAQGWKRSPASKTSTGKTTEKKSEK